MLAKPRQFGFWDEQNRPLRKKIGAVKRAARRLEFNYNLVLQYAGDSTEVSHDET